MVNMKVVRGVAGALALSGCVSAKEMAKDEIRAAQLYDSGIMMDRILAKKQVRVLIHIYCPVI